MRVQSSMAMPVHWPSRFIANGGASFVATIKSLGAGAAFCACAGPIGDTRHANAKRATAESSGLDRPVRRPSNQEIDIDRILSRNAVERVTHFLLSSISAC